MTISEKMEEALNFQINKEFYSSYLYLSMAAHFDSMGLAGFANWMKVQAQEEDAHAMGIYNHIIRRGGKVNLDKIDAPQTSWDNILGVFEHVLEHEKYITSLINDLADTADDLKDKAAASFIKWYIDEQVEEESSAKDIIDKLKLINCNGNAIFALDHAFAARTFTAPVIK